MNNQPNSSRLILGGQAIAAALAIGSSPLLAQEVQDNCTESTEANCEISKTAKEIERIQVHGVRHSIYNVNKSGDLRRVADLVDTPQVITVLTQDQIQESGNTDLKEILSSQAGVTLGTGENGNAFGDRYIIRGHEARSDVFVDGLRDPGMTTRESFATERVEITKGPSSTFAGRGSSGGAVNSVTKKASTSYNFGRVDGSLGTDEYHRLTIDYNAAISEDVAVRLNALSASEDKPGREGIEKERTGFQLSSTFLASDDLKLTADIYHLNAEDKPDLGSYFDSDKRKPLEDIPVYAQEYDFLESEVTTFTLHADYKLNDSVRITNSTRVGETENGYITTGMGGGEQYIGVDSADDVTDETATVDTLTISTHQGWQEVEYFASQTNVFLNTKILDTEHKFVFGFDYSNETVDNGVYSVTNNNPTNCITSGHRGVSDSYCIIDQNGDEVSNIGSLMGRSYVKGDSDALNDVETFSFYLMDSFKVAENTQLHYGFRADHFDYSNEVVSRGAEASYAYADTAYNGHLGLVHEVVHDVNIYVNYSTATNINGGESDLGANCGYGGLCGDPEQASQASPERVENIEIGTKLLVADDSLLLTAALFQVTKSDVMESVGDAYSTLGSLNTGENKIKGIELGASGDITEQLSIQFSASIMDSEVTKSYDDSNVGLALSNFAEKSAFLQLRYELNEDFVFGGSIAYQGEMYGGQPDTSAGYDEDNARYSIVVPSYSVVNLFANYNATEQLTLRANVGNVFDKEYWTAAYRSGAFMYLGDGQNVRLTATYEF